MFSSQNSQVSSDANYIEDVFQTWLYTGNGSTQTITNGIDLSTKGGLVWTKGRSAITDNMWFDTARGVQKELSSNKTNAQATNTLGITAFGATGYSMGSDGSLNGSGTTYASWTFRKQPKFFDVVTYTGDGTARQIAHSLGSAPGCIIVKRTDTTGNWQVWHKDVAAAGFGAMNLNSTAAAVSGNYVFRGASFQTATQFGVDSDATVNASGGTYVAYLFAHNAGGFGLTGTDNVISCGSFTTNAGGSASVTLGYEPQWILYKQSDAIGDWRIADTMRGLTYYTDNYLRPNLSSAEFSQSLLEVNATGFSWGGGNTNANYIYIAIRRGPMKVPTSGTSVFAPVTFSTPNSFLTTGFVVDTVLDNVRAGWARNTLVTDRLRGGTQSLETSNTAVESGAIAVNSFAYNNGYYDSASGGSQISYSFRRAPSFFDEVCYTGTGADQYVTHNLGVAPELVIFKNRTDPSSQNPGWYVQVPNVLGTGALKLNTTAAVTASFFAGLPTSTQLRTRVSSNYAVNYPGYTFVAYLFASCPGVSKVGSYTGTGTTQQINCGFSAGARFVLIKRTDSTGDWYVWDSARGIVSGNDPYLLLNSTAAEVTSTDYIDTYSAGFEISSTAPAAINASGGSFIFLAIA